MFDYGQSSWPVGEPDPASDPDPGDPDPGGDPRTVGNKLWNEYMKYKLQNRY